MNILVCLKQVPDTETKIKINSTLAAIESSGIKWVMNPYDEFAVEEALKLRDKLSDGSKVLVYTLGPKARAVEVLRTALAMGADDAVLIDAPENLDPNSVAKALSVALKKESDVGVVFTGKQAIDDDCSQVSQLLAEFLGFRHATVVIKCELGSDKNHFLVEREVEGGSKEIIQIQKPAVIGAQKGLNTPRYASLPGIMKAKKKEIKEIPLSSLGVSDTDKKINFKNFQLPPERPQAKIFEGDVAANSVQLVKLLREEAKVI
ncbi:MAG: electron transfer flavoprotein subunit beta/FixA family protein [Oligoflexia bacterium]|nr:electron transfer flavoprotein subunit beta/FixA family protein [Oligoflexia bacterium]